MNRVTITECAARKLNECHCCNSTQQMHDRQMWCPVSPKTIGSLSSCNKVSAAHVVASHVAQLQHHLCTHIAAAIRLLNAGQQGYMTYRDAVCNNALQIGYRDRIPAAVGLSSGYLDMQDHISVATAFGHSSDLPAVLSVPALHGNFTSLSYDMQTSCMLAHQQRLLPELQM